MVKNEKKNQLIDLVRNSIEKVEEIKMNIEDIIRKKEKLYENNYDLYYSKDITEIYKENGKRWINIEASNKYIEIKYSNREREESLEYSLKNNGEFEIRIEYNNPLIIYGNRKEINYEPRSNLRKIDSYIKTIKEFLEEVDKINEIIKY